jgi:deoxycytidylate deaminase
MSTGYNGPARGMKHCIDVPCAGATAESGKDLDTCEAIHAEVNAISQCSDIQKIAEIYCTTAPCVSCTKVLLNTGALRIFFTESYAQAEQAKHIDNFIKPFLDILQMKYGFNDKQIYKLSVLKEIVNKGSEGITFKIENLEYT